MSNEEQRREHISRRRFLGLAGGTVAASALGAAAFPAWARTSGTATVTGTVFEERKNGAAGRDLRGVPVSDGKTVVETDKRGRYRLTVDLGRRITPVVFVSVPDGYAAPTNEYMTPRFYRTLTGLQNGEERTADFPLRRAPGGQGQNGPSPDFLTMTDIHVGVHDTAEDARMLTSQIAQLNEVSAPGAFVLVSGDLVHHATEEQFRAYGEAMGISRRPVWPATGNHDFSGGSEYRLRVENYRRFFGPEWYSFDSGGWHFVILENYLGFGQPEQLEWLRQDLELAGDRPVVAVMHYPLDAPETPATGTAAYVKLLEAHGARLLLTGHTHVNDASTSPVRGADHVVTNSTGHNTNDLTPPGYRRVSLLAGKVEYPFHAFDVDRRLVLVNPAPDGVLGAGPTTVQINAEDSSSIVKMAEFRVDGGEWRELEPSGQISWTASYDASDLSLGPHAFEARVRDDASRTWERSATFSVGDAAAISAGQDWTMFHADTHHTGRADDTVSPGLRLAWCHHTPGRIVTSSPAVAGGAAFVGLRDEAGTRNNGVLAVDLASGERRWSFPTEAMVQSSPAVSGGVVYAASIRGTLHAIDASSGAGLWRSVNGIEADGVQRGRAYHPPTIADGAVVYQGYSARDASYLLKLDGNTGQEIWRSRLNRDHFHALSPVVDGDRLYVVAGGSQMAALDAATGRQIWRRRPAVVNWMHSIPAFEDGRIFVGFRTGILVAMDAATGYTLWSYESRDPSLVTTEISPAGPAVDDGTVYTGFDDGNVSAFDAATGERKWSHRTGGGVFSSPAISGETIYVGSNDGYLYGLDRQTGEEVWKFEIGPRVASSPAVSGNVLVVGAYDGNLYAFTEKE